MYPTQSVTQATRILIMNDTDSIAVADSGIYRKNGSRDSPGLFMTSKAATKQPITASHVIKRPMVQSFAVVRETSKLGRVSGREIADIVVSLISSFPEPSELDTRGSKCCSCGRQAMV
jgi:hypothetical protein